MAIPTRYRVDFPRLAWLLLPALLRRPRLLGLAQWLTSPVARLYDRFTAYEATVRRELSYNSQVLLFEAALNDHYDAALRRIYLHNSDVELQNVYVNFLSEQQPRLPVYHQAEGKPPLYFHYLQAFASQTDFTVYAPQVLRPRARQLRAAIERLKLATRHYQLIFY